MSWVLSTQTVMIDLQKPCHWPAGMTQAPVAGEKEHLIHPGEIRADFQVEEIPR